MLILIKAYKVWLNNGEHKWQYYNPKEMDTLSLEEIICNNPTII